MYKQIFEINVPYRKPDNPTLTSRFGRVVTYQPLYDYFTTPPRIYGEEFSMVNAMFVKKEATVNSPVVIILNVVSRNIYFPLVGQSLKFDGVTGALLGYGPLIGDALDSEIVQSLDGSLWGASPSTLRELDPNTYAVIQTIPADFFEKPNDQMFNGIVRPMIDRSRGIMVMSGFPPDVDARYILVYNFATGALIRRIWVSGAVAQIMQEDDRRCFVVCTNGIINVVDYTTGKILSTTRAPTVGYHTVFGNSYAWDFVLRRLLVFNFIDGGSGAPPINPDGSSSNTITGYYPVPIATNITRPIPLKPPRKGRTVPMLVRAVGDAGEAIPSVRISVTATGSASIAAGPQVTDNYGYARLNLAGIDAGLSEVSVSADVDYGTTGTTGSVGTGGSTGSGSSTSSVAPTLSSPTAAQTGASTASGTVSTNQSTGWLYTLFSTSSTANASDVRAGKVQNVTATGAQNVSMAGLTPNTTYYPHYLHRNSAGLESAVATGASFTTAATDAGTGTGTGGGQSAQPIAVGSQIAPLTVENTSSSAATDQPFSIGHVFAQGHLPAADAGITLAQPDGSAIACQFNVKALHPDGSVRHAQVSGVIANIAAGDSVSLSMKRASAAAGTSVGLPASLPSATLSISGTVYSAVPTASTPYSTWFAGPVASDFIFNVPFVTAGGTPHPTLTAQFSVRAYSTGHVRVDYVIEHCQAYASTTDITYDATLYMAGQPVYSRSGLVHTPTGRWKRTVWRDATPVLHTRHDINYLLDSLQVPNYDRSITMSETYLNEIAATLTTANYDPMGFGRFRAYMPDYGGRPDIGLMPDSHAALVLSMDKRAWDVVMASADIGGSWPMCRRDDSTGPGRGYPLSVNNFPYASILGSPGDCDNPATGKNEHLPNLTTVSTGVPDSSHMPDIYYLPYLLSGDYFYLEGLHFACTFNHYQDNPYYREFAKAHVHADQLRGQGWRLRTLAECAAITPDDHYLKSHFIGWYNNNMKWYLDAYLDTPIAVYQNELGIITNGYTVSYDVNGGTTNGMPPWMDDFFVQSLGHGYELLGLATTRRLLEWKSKFQLGRMNDPAICVLDACIYALGVRSTATSPFFTTLAECWNFSVSAASQSHPCGSPERLAGTPCLPGDIDGYPASESGFPADYQPALSYCVSLGLPGSDEAWSKFMARPTKPDYGLYGPQFAVVKR